MLNFWRCFLSPAKCLCLNQPQFSHNFCCCSQLHLTFHRNTHIFWHMAMNSEVNGKLTTESFFQSLWGTSLFSVQHFPVFSTVCSKISLASPFPFVLLQTHGSCPHQEVLRACLLWTHSRTAAEQIKRYEYKLQHSNSLPWWNNAFSWQPISGQLKWELLWN